MDYVQAIKGLRDEIQRSETEHKAKMKALHTAFNELIKLNTVCENCGGAKGSVYRIVAEAEPAWHACSVCRGTGKAKK